MADLLDAGSLDRRIRIEQRGVTRNSSGEAIEGWTLLAEVWASKRDLIGRDAIAARAQDFDGDTQWRVRWRADVVPATCRIFYDGRAYEISSVAEIGRRGGLEVVTRRP